MAVTQPRGSTTERGYGSRWQKERKAFLSANPLCRLCQDLGRTTLATVVDHIKSHKGNEVLMWDHRNWQPVCVPCHSLKTVTQDGGLNSGGSPHPEWLPPPACQVTLVTGPAGAGKSTYCETRRSANDIIIDLDQCVLAVSGIHGHMNRNKDDLSRGLRYRNKLLASLAARRTGRAWVIVSAPSQKERDWWVGKLKAQVINLDPGLDVCLSRLPRDRQDIARQWYKQRERNNWVPAQSKKKAIGLDGWPV